MVKPTDRRVRERVVVKSPVRENRPPGSVRGTRGNPRPYSISFPPPGRAGGQPPALPGAFPVVSDSFFVYSVYCVTLPLLE